MVEKRKFIRFKLLLKGEFPLIVEGKFSPRLLLTDFSRGGLRILIPQTDFLKKDLVTLKIYLPNRTPPISIHGGIKWMGPKEDYWEVGININKMNPIDKSEILDYAYKIWREKKIN